MVFSGGVAWIFQVLVLDTQALCFFYFMFSQPARRVLLFYRRAIDNISWV
jgi:hypothetical protein